MARLTRTLPGRLVLLSAAVAVALSLLQQFVDLSAPVDLVRKLLTLAALLGAAGLLVYTISQSRRQVLWHVRRRLILSYIFLGVVPLVLVVAFVLTGGVLMYTTLAQYLFEEAVSKQLDEMRHVAELAAATPSPAALGHVRQEHAGVWPALSLAVVPAERGALMALAGPWEHSAPPSALPSWLTRAGHFSGATVVADARQPDGRRIVLRAVAPAGDSGMVVADLPLDDSLVDRLQSDSGARLRSTTVQKCGGAGPGPPSAVRNVWTPFREAEAFMDCTAWEDGSAGTIAMTLDAPLAALANRLASVHSSEIAATIGQSWWTVLLQLLVLLGVLFLIIQGSALVVGGVLARSITSAVHELFIGTERVRQGDFVHRIPIASRDQLGELAESFNRMSGSIEQLLHVQRQKQRLDDELRIARDIQRSLLPARLPATAGLDVADLCEPAREVGGDYYDFFELSPTSLGVLIADVAGKGTSAALYMAEMKGLMLALSHDERSPRQLLIEVNRRLVAHLDNRTFITMTYAIFDLAAGTLTAARAGHTPLLLSSAKGTELMTPDGMVLGIRLPGAASRFEEVLVEHTCPIVADDVIVLYTDGITEATNTEGELFGDNTLAQVVARHRHLDAAGIREQVLREVRGFVGDAEPHDDMTMVVIKVGERQT